MRARVTLIRSIPDGVGVSYGHRFVSSRPSRLAVVSIGYADGVIRSLSGRIHVLHQGRTLPQVGAITMDQLLVDATEASDLEAGSIVTLLGRDGEREITPQEWRIAVIRFSGDFALFQRLPRLRSEPKSSVAADVISGQYAGLPRMQRPLERWLSAGVPC